MDVSIVNNFENFKDFQGHAKPVNKHTIYKSEQLTAQNHSNYSTKEMLERK